MVTLPFIDLCCGLLLNLLLYAAFVSHVPNDASARTHSGIVAGFVLCCIVIPCLIAAGMTFTFSKRAARHVAPCLLIYVYVYIFKTKWFGDCRGVFFF